MPNTRSKAAHYRPRHAFSESTAKLSRPNVAWQQVLGCRTRLWHGADVRTWEVRNVLPRQSFLRPQAVSLNMYQRVAGSLDRSADTGAACRPSCQRIGYLIWYLATKMSSAASSYLSLEKLAAFFWTVASSLTPGQCFGRSAGFSAQVAF